MVDTRPGLHQVPSLADRLAAEERNQGRRNRVTGLSDTARPHPVLKGLPDREKTVVQKKNAELGEELVDREDGHDNVDELSVG